MTRAFEYDVFISHSTATRAFARHLASKLRELDFHVWTPSRLTRPGSKRIAEVMENSAVCILLFGPEGNSPWANKFVWSAISNRIHRTDGKFRVIPVLLRAEGSRDNQLITEWNESWQGRHQAGPFIRFGNNLDEDAINRLVLRIRGVDYREESIWNDAGFREKIRHRAQNFLNVNWLTLANSVEVDQLGSSSSAQLPLLMPFLSNRVLQGHFGQAPQGLSCADKREASSRMEKIDKEVRHFSTSQREVQNIGVEAAPHSSLVEAAPHSSLVEAAPHSSLRRQFLETFRNVWLKECTEHISVFTDDAVGQRSQPLSFIMNAYDRSAELMTYRQLVRNFVQHIFCNTEDNLDRQWLVSCGKDDGPNFSRLVNHPHKIRMSIGLFAATQLRNDLKIGQCLKGFLTENRSSRCVGQTVVYAPSHISREMTSIRALMDCCEILGATNQTSAWKSNTDYYRDWLMMGTKNVSWLEPNQYSAAFMMDNELICLILDGFDNELIRLNTSPKETLHGCSAFWQAKDLYGTKSDSASDDRGASDIPVIPTRLDDGDISDLLKVFGMYPEIVDGERLASS